MSLTRMNVTRKDSAEAAVTRRNVSAAAANRRRVRAMFYGDVLVLGRSIMPATLDHDSLIKRHVYQTSRPAGAGFRRPADGFGRDRRMQPASASRMIARVVRFEYPSYDKDHTGHESDSVND